MNQQERELKLLTCQQCIHSKCGNSFMNKCSKDDLICQVSDKNVLAMIESEGKCPKNYWNFTVANSEGGCGCGG